MCLVCLINVLSLSDKLPIEDKRTFFFKLTFYCTVMSPGGRGNELNDPCIPSHINEEAKND